MGQTHLVTGVAGFIGSQLAEALVDSGDRVIGVDCFTPYYDLSSKQSNIKDLLVAGNFELHRLDLRTDPIEPLLEGVDIVYHQAAQPGVRLSWANGFEEYSTCNVLATQRLLEAARTVGTSRLVYASSSSVYGNAERYPVVETDLPAPHSPYGVTKLAGEHLCGLYARNHGVPTVSLRYFTVYGPRQRPDMAHHRLIECALTETPFPLYGDGAHVRDFTFVDDVVRANVLSGSADIPPGTVMNICAGGATVIRDLIEEVGRATGAALTLDERSPQPGDVLRTGGSHALATSLLGWEPVTSLSDGVAAQVAWHRTSRRPRGGSQRAPGDGLHEAGRRARKADPGDRQMSDGLQGKERR